MSSDRNVDTNVVRGLGQELSTFLQVGESLSREQRQTIFDGYFWLFQWSKLPTRAGIDLECDASRRSISNGVRVVLAWLPHPMRKAISETIATQVYWPLARLAALLAGLGIPKQSLPLS